MSVIPYPPTLATTPAIVVSLEQLRGRALFARGGGARVNPLFATPREADLFHHPPLGVVVGAGAVGALAGHLVFHSMLISAGLGVGAMGLAASSDDRAGEIARSSGRMALAAFERTSEVNDRYHLTDRLVESAKTTGRRLKEFDREHAVVHRATQGAKQAWRDLRHYDETHNISARAGNALSSGLDKVAEALAPPADPSRSPAQSHTRGGSGSSSPRTQRDDGSGGVRGRHEGDGVGEAGWEGNGGGGEGGDSGSEGDDGTGRPRFDGIGDRGYGGTREEDGRQYRDHHHHRNSREDSWYDTPWRVVEEDGEDDDMWGDEDVEWRW